MSNQHQHDEQDEKAVRSIPLDTEDGTVVIEQQNMGGQQQVGGGEYKNDAGRSVERAAEEQERLERDAPIHEPDPDAPGRAALHPLDEAPDVEPNEPA